MAWQLADALRGYLWIGQHVDEWLATAHHGLQAAQSSAHRPAEAAMHANLGTLYLRLGELRALRRAPRPRRRAVPRRWATRTPKRAC